MKNNLYEDLVWRGLIKDISSPKLEEKLNNESMTFYIGTDPTADSLHLGHLSSFLISKRLKDAGHNPILLIGGGTGLIGDPRPTEERDVIVKDELFKNLESLKKQVDNLFGFKIVNNYDWIKDIRAIDYLRDYGKYFNVNYMINKDIVKRRLDSGITYCELSYMILQALDFLHLFKEENCVMQVAGSDQWGNITAGIDLIRKKTGKEAYGFTMPLVTDKHGNKFGKSEGNALWLDKNKTTPYDIYQYLFNTEDEMVMSYLKIFTFLSKEEIEAIEQDLKTKPEARLAQKTLAFEVVKFIHGKEEAILAKEKSENLFAGNITEDIKPLEINCSTNILEIMINSNIASSKSEAKRLVEQGGISVDNIKITDSNHEVAQEEFVLQKGKKVIIKIKNNN